MKRILAIVIAIILLVPMIMSVNAGVMERTKFSPWAAEYINKAISKNLTENKDYTYINPVTREEFCEFIYNLLVSLEKEIAGDTSVSFNDTQNEKILALGSAGIIKGKDENRFAPNDYLTREESAVILDRMQRKYFDFVHTLIYFMFDDNSDISSWAESSIQTICNLGFMKGTGDNKFSPKDTFTVEEALTTLVRISDFAELSAEKADLSFADKVNEKMPKDKNYMFSPFSIKMALSMASNGAEGETLDEIKSVLDIDDLNLYNNHVKNLIEAYSQSEILKLDVSNSVWINKSNTDQNFSDEFINIVKGSYNGETGFVTKENALDTINGWVNEKTKGKIPTIITKDNTNFWAILINAVYFKGRWQNEFFEGATKLNTFTDKNGKETEIDFMNRVGYFGYSDNDGIEVVELPYKNHEEILDENGYFAGVKRFENIDVSMFLIMGERPYNPEDVLNKTELNTVYADFFMPKFNIEYSTSLNDVLQEIGIKKAFSPVAEFEKMFDKGNMSITDTIHKTYIKVDEEGTEAAAVTGIGMAGSALPPKPVTIKFNKPFTFVIKDKVNNEILFMGEFSFSE